MIFVMLVEDMHILEIDFPTFNVALQGQITGKLWEKKLKRNRLDFF